MKNRLVTVIGGGGFLGRYVAQALFAAGARVRVAQRDPRAAWYLRPLAGLGQVQFVAADVGIPETIAAAVAGADAVVNLAGILAGDFARVHVAGAATIARASAAAGVGALVQMSAIGADPASASSYGRSKGLGELAVRAAFPAATILRPSVVFGREDAFLNRFAAMIAATPVVPVLRAPVRFQPVYVTDVADAVVAALARDAGSPELFELGGPDILSMAALLAWIARTIERHPRMLALPDPIGGAIAALGFLPGAPITRDQWVMLQQDNVVAPGMPGLAELGITPTPLDAVAPAWLVRYRRGGRFALPAAA